MAAFTAAVVPTESTEGPATRWTRRERPVTNGSMWRRAAARTVEVGRHREEDQEPISLPARGSGEGVDYCGLTTWLTWRRRPHTFAT